MAVSIDRWAPGVPATRTRSTSLPRRRVARPQADRFTQPQRLRADFENAPQPRASSAAPHARDQASQALCGKPSSIATKGFWIWLACGLALTLTCPPLASMQTSLGALPLWLVGLPAASLLSVAIARKTAPR